MNIDVMAEMLCGHINRQFTTLEWEIYVSEITEDDKYDANTCQIEIIK